MFLENIYIFFYANNLLNGLLDKTMRTQLVLIIPLLAAMASVFAVVGLNSVLAQSISIPESNMTSGTNATMCGNMTGAGNMTNASSPMMTNSS
jgi:hypothetical protein